MLYVYYVAFSSLSLCLTSWCMIYLKTKHYGWESIGAEAASKSVVPIGKGSFFAPALNKIEPKLVISVVEPTCCNVVTNFKHFKMQQFVFSIGIVQLIQLIKILS
uniref:Uncharacterized protein n=1 Tax=Micrurus spixii TaxID=129469 RepID=A0A2D4LBV3_9SAUR